MFLQYHISCQYASLLMDRKFMFDETWRECSIGKQIKKRIQDKAKNKINPFILTFSYIFIIFLYFYNSCSLPMLLSWYSCSWTVGIPRDEIYFFSSRPLSALSSVIPLLSPPLHKSCLSQGDVRAPTYWYTLVDCFSVFPASAVRDGGVEGV